MNAGENIEHTGLGEYKISKVLYHLYERSAPLLTPEELKLIAGSTDEAMNQAENMAEAVGNIASMINDSEIKDGFTEHQTSMLFFQISNQFDLLAGMIRIGLDADFRLKNPDKFP